MVISEVISFIESQKADYQSMADLTLDKSKEAACLTVVNTYQSVLNFINGGKW